MVPVTRRVIVAVTFTLLIAAQASTRADTIISPDSSFSVGGSWSSGGGTLSFFNVGLVPGNILFWSGTGWDSYGRDFSGSGYCCGYGTHQVQSTYASANAVMYFTNDGNLLMLDGGNVLWQTFTGANFGGVFNLQNDHNLVVYNSSSQPLWSLF